MSHELKPNIFQAFYHSLLDLVFPNSCFICQTLLPQQQLLCSSCFNNNAKLCSKIICDKKNFNVFSLFAYSPPLDKLIHSKFNQNTNLIEQLGRLLWQTPGLQTTIAQSGVANWYFVPVPLHWQRFWHRGFNQATLLANGLASVSGLPVLNALKRHKSTKPQSQTTSKLERLENLKNAIVLNNDWFGDQQKLPQTIKGSGIILVDDLLTSGSTLLACHQVINKFNPATIIAVTVCRG